MFPVKHCFSVNIILSVRLQKLMYANCFIDQKFLSAEPAASFLNIELIFYLYVSRETFLLKSRKKCPENKIICFV